MPMGEIQQIAVWITAVAAAGGILWKVYRRFADAVEGIRCILRSEMLRVYYHNREAEQIRQFLTKVVRQERCSLSVITPTKMQEDA